MFSLVSYDLDMTNSKTSFEYLLGIQLKTIRKYAQLDKQLKLDYNTNTNTVFDFDITIPKHTHTRAIWNTLWTHAVYYLVFVFFFSLFFCCLKCPF